MFAKINARENKCARILMFLKGTFSDFKTSLYNLVWVVVYHCQFSFSSGKQNINKYRKEKTQAKNPSRDTHTRTLFPDAIGCE